MSWVPSVRFQPLASRNAGQPSAVPHGERQPEPFTLRALRLHPGEQFGNTGTCGQRRGLRRRGASRQGGQPGCLPLPMAPLALSIRHPVIAEGAQGGRTAGLIAGYPDQPGLFPRGGSRLESSILEARLGLLGLRVPLIPLGGVRPYPWGNILDHILFKSTRGTRGNVYDFIELFEYP